MPKKKATVAEPVAEAAVQVPRPRLNRFKVSNFRCIGSQPVEVDLDDIVILVGPNNTGKTAILRAYEIVMHMVQQRANLRLTIFRMEKLLKATYRQSNSKLSYSTRPRRANAGSEQIRKPMKCLSARDGCGTRLARRRRLVGDVAANNWHASEGPWGAPNVAQAFRP